MPKSKIKVPGTYKFKILSNKSKGRYPHNTDLMHAGDVVEFQVIQDDGIYFSYKHATADYNTMQWKEVLLIDKIKFIHLGSLKSMVNTSKNSFIRSRSS
jgi:hypothetical protein